MRCIGLGAVVSVGLLAGCGGGGATGASGPGTVPSTPASPLNDAAPIAVYNGTTAQGLAVSAEQPDNARITVVLAWRGSCVGAGWVGAHQPLREARFDLDGLPGRARDSAREPGDDGDATTYLRQIDVDQDSDGIRGHFRIRSRSWNGQAHDMDGLCDSGRVSFQAQRLAKPRVQPLTPRRGEFAGEAFQEQLTDAVAQLQSAIGARDTEHFCGLLSERLRRTMCAGGRQATIDRMAALQFIADLPTARHAGADNAITVLPTGAERLDGTTRLRTVRDLRFVTQRSGGPEPPIWLLHRVGEEREQRVR